MDKAKVHAVAEQIGYNMIVLPRTPEEFTHWKLSNTQFDYECDRHDEEIWQWIVKYGIPLFRNHFKFRKEVDMGLGFGTYIYYFDEQIILTSSDGFGDYASYSFTKLASIHGDFEYESEII